MKNFVLNVHDVKEESITDYLVWKWREADDRFKYIDIHTFTRQEESTTTGADFQLQLWLVGKTHHLPLVFQAKKLTKKYAAYHAMLNYPFGTQSQLTTILSYAQATGHIPFYMFYGVADSETTADCCGAQVFDTSVFMADAHVVKRFADGHHGKRIAKNALLGAARPFSCMFCCQPNLRNMQYVYSKKWFLTFINDDERYKNENLPDYVTQLVDVDSSELGAETVPGLITRYELSVFRAVAVYDLRDSAWPWNIG